MSGRMVCEARFRLWPALGTALLLVLLPLGTSKLVAAEGEREAWVADLPAIRSTWSRQPSIVALEDAFRSQVVIGDRIVIADTHLFGDRIRILPYHNADGVADASGKRLERGDQVLAQAFPPGEIAVAVKHHRPTRRRVELPTRSVFTLREHLKLQDTHALLVIGIERDGRPGAMTLSSPQSYESGRFGTASYPMIFFRPVYPDYLTTTQKEAFRDNIRTFAVTFSALSQLPCNYSGGDPLAADGTEAVREQAAMAVRALAGDEEARSWFRLPENLLYCAELIHLAASAGLLTPLNARTFEPLVGTETWARFAEQVALHRAGSSSRFSELNENRYVSAVELLLAPKNLKPAAEYAPPHRRPLERHLLAFRPMTMSDMVELFVRTHVPRATLGEKEGALLQSEVLRAISPGLLELFGLADQPADSEDRQRVEEAFTRILSVVERPHGSYEQFRRELEPLLEEIRRLTRDRTGETAQLLIPPSLFHVVAEGLWSGGLLGLQYAGHGLHVSLVRRAP